MFQVTQQTLQVPARRIQPSDRLPPQPALHGTPWQESGFDVGGSEDDVLLSQPVVSGNVLLFGPDGVLSSVAGESVVTVERGTRNDRQDAASEH